MADGKFETTPLGSIRPKIDREMLKRWKAGMELHNQMVLEEKRNQTPAERRTHRMPYIEVQKRLRDRQ